MYELLYNPYTNSVVFIGPTFLIEDDTSKHVGRSSFMNIDVLDSSGDDRDDFPDPVEYHLLERSSVDRIIRKRINKLQKKSSVIFKVLLGSLLKVEVHQNVATIYKSPIDI